MKLPTKFLVPTQITKRQLPRYTKNADEVAQLGFGVDYKKRWTVWMGIREFVQNAFDIITSSDPKSRKRLDTVELKYDAKRKIGYIIDQGSGIKFRNMFLSESKGGQRWEAKCLRGRFGEGMKYALLPLLRDKHQILIRTVGADYHFTSVIVGKKGETFSLVHMLQTPNNNKKGTCIAISGVDPNDFRHRFIPFLERDEPKAVLLTATEECIARHALAVEVQGAGALYIRDIYVSKINSYYSYNFWFEDTTEILDPDRNHLKVDDDEKYLVGEEFFTLLEKIDTPKGRQFWKNLLSEMYSDTGKRNARNPDEWRNKKTGETSSEQRKRRSGRRKLKKRTKRTKKNAQKTFEWKYLHEYEYETLDYRQSKTLFEVISEVVGTPEFSWSKNYKEGKILEHFDVLDLRDKLPNLHPQVYDFVKSAAQLDEMDELQEKIVSLPLWSFESISGRFANKIRDLHEELEDAADDLLNLKSLWDDDEEDEDEESERKELNKLHFYTGSYNEGAEGVAGYYSPAENAIYIHAKYLEDPKYFIMVFIHEMAHAHCEGCDDITETFENALEEMGFAYQYGEYGRIWKLLISLKYMLEDDHEKEKFDQLLSRTSEEIKIIGEKQKQKQKNAKEKRMIVWKQRAKREKRKKRKNISQLLLRANLLYLFGDASLPSTKEARQLLLDTNRLLKRKTKRRRRSKKKIQKLNEKRYKQRIDRDRAIAALRRGTRDDHDFLFAQEEWDSFLWDDDYYVN